MSRISNIKKDDIINYINDKLNSNTQDVLFSTGLDGMPLFQPMTKDTADGKIETYEFIDETTYKRSLSNAVPYSLPVIEGDYANLKTIEQDKQIRSSNWTVGLSFLVFTGSYVQTKLVFAIEEFRDKLLGGFDTLEVYEFNYDNAETAGVSKDFNVVTTASDLVAGGIVVINGKTYIEYVLTVDLDVGDGLSYGNQFEFYISSETSPYNVNTSRVLPIQASFGASNSLMGAQLLKQPTFLTPQALKRSQAMHNIIASRGWAINFTLLLERDKPIIKELFREMVAFKDLMNKSKYSVVMKYKYFNGTNYVYDNDLSFDYDVVVGEISTEVVMGDNVMFSIGFALSWDEV